MKLIAWNATTCPARTVGSGGVSTCPSALWFWVALTIAGAVGLFRSRRTA